MKITIEIDSDAEMEKLSALLETFNIQEINVTAPASSAAILTKGNKKIDPKSLFGIWANNPRSLNELRTAGWLRKQN